MVRTQIQLTDEQARRVKAVAAREGISVSAVVRRSLDKALTGDRLPDDAEIRRRAIEAAGCFNSGLGDLSERHDDYLAEAYSE
jgi:plasmid stability protein